MEEFDWMFDYVLQFFESDVFDAHVMNFIDERCAAFDNDEENKFIYTDIHNEFIEHMETLIASSLADLGITIDAFYDACKHSRNGRDVNRTVFEKLLAMEDFLIFKKIMVKRNVQLQCEAMQSLMENDEQYAEKDVSYSFLSSDLPMPDQLEMTLRQKEDDFDGCINQEELENMYRESMLELELIHKHQELEQLELEQALAMSLLVEEEKLQILKSEAKLSESNQERKDQRPASDDKRNTSDFKDTKKSGSKQEEKETQLKASFDFADPKPLKLAPLNSGSKALPPIRNNDANTNKLASNALLEKKKLAEEAFKLNQQVVKENRAHEKEFSAAAMNIDDERAKHMKDQREKLIALKKKEREAILKKEQEKKGQERDESKIDDLKKMSESKISESKDFQEEQRSALRNALARKLKNELIESEEAKINKLFDEQFASLDTKLQQVEQQRQENIHREILLTEHLRKQQEKMARNVQRSAMDLRDQRY